MLQTYLRYRYKKIKRTVRKEFTLPVIYLTTSFLLGIVIFNFTLLVQLAVLLTLVILLRKDRKKLVLITITFALGFLYASLWSNQLNDEKTDLQNQRTEFESTVIEPPEQNLYDQQLIVSSDEYISNLIINTESYPTLNLQDKLTVEGQITPIEETTDLTGYINFLKSKKIFYELEQARVFKLEEDTNLLSRLAELKERFRVVINQNLNETEASFLSGILFGTKDNLNEEFEENLVRTGTTHIISASGFNVAILYIFVISFRKLLGIRLTRLMSIGLIIFYVLLIGTYNLPAMRAGIMLVIIILANHFGRKHNILAALNISIVIILLLYPFYWQNISFQLSVAATVGLFYLSGIIQPPIKKLVANDTITEVISSTVGAILATLPITIFTFGGVSLIALPSNLLILPLIPLVMLIGFLALIFALFSISFLADILFSLTDSILSYTVSVINRLGEIEPVYSDSKQTAVIFFIILITFVLALDLYGFKRKTTKAN